VSGWIKWEKDLETDPRTLRILRDLPKLCNAPALHGNALVTLVCGALQRMWSYADSHIRSDDTLDMGASELDEYLGIADFCSVLPEDWLVVVDENTLKLPDYQSHNGVEAKKKALTQKRVAKHRQKERNASALPDQTRPEETRPEEERDARAREAPRETVIDCGTNLTRTAAEIYSGMLDDWRRDVPECSPAAFARWIVHRESRGKVMGAAQRLGQAKQLAGNGDFAVQAEVVDFCIAQGWNSLVPIADVRARRDGMSRAKPEKKRWHPNDGDPTEPVAARLV
jgi:hypothetical protein